MLDVGCWMLEMKLFSWMVVITKTRWPLFKKPLTKLKATLSAPPLLSGGKLSDKIKIFISLM